MPGLPILYTRMKKYKWTTHKVVQETKDSVTIFFDAGREPFVYKPGQFLNVTCHIAGELVSRSYSFSSHPDEPFPSITIKRVEGGRMSNYLVDEATHVTEWSVEAPFGNFTLDVQGQATELVFLSGGSGISPLLSMIKSTKGIIQPLLLYSNRTPEDIIFARELQELHQREHLKPFYALSGGTAESVAEHYTNGRFSRTGIQALITKHVKDTTTARYFICGPEPLMALYQEALLDIGIPKGQLHAEHFDPLPPETEGHVTEGGTKEVLVTFYETRQSSQGPSTFECTRLVPVPAEMSLMRAFRENGIQVSSGCSKGTCGSCWAIREKGSVNMVRNYALSDEELAEGKILLCQSFPLDESVSIIIN